MQEEDSHLLSLLGMICSKTYLTNHLVVTYHHWAFPTQASGGFEKRKEDFVCFFFVSWFNVLFFCCSVSILCLGLFNFQIQLAVFSNYTCTWFKESDDSIRLLIKILVP